MKTFDVDVFIPTLKNRTANLICQIHTALNSDVKSRVTISIPDDDYPELMDQLTTQEKEKVRILKNVPQGEPSIPIKYCLENYGWCDWIFNDADDDCLLPWGLKHLLEASQNVSMVVGQIIGVSRDKHYDFSSWKIGHSITQCHISKILFHFPSLVKLPKPWLEINPVSDFIFAKRMADNFAYKIIPSVVSVAAFAELYDLGVDFESNFRLLYGSML
jgi:hypothetical protein